MNMQAKYDLHVASKKLTGTLAKIEPHSQAA